MDQVWVIEAKESDRCRRWRYVLGSRRATHAEAAQLLQERAAHGRSAPVERIACHPVVKRARS